MAIKSASSHLLKAILINDIIAKVFIPKPFQYNNQMKWLWHIVATLPGILLFIPLLNASIQKGEFEKGILKMLLIGLAIFGAFSLVSHGKQEAIKVLSILEKFLNDDDVLKIANSIDKNITFRKQIIFGTFFTTVIVFIAQFYSMNLWTRFSVSLAIIYASFLLGTGTYLVFCGLIVIRQLKLMKYKLPTLLPCQTVELRRIADIGVSLSITGAILASTISLSVLGIEVVFNIRPVLYSNILGFSVVILSWIIIATPFISSQDLITHIIKQAKETVLSQLSLIIEKTLNKIEVTNDIELIGHLQKTQTLYEQVYKSSELIIDLGILGKFISSLLLVQSQDIANCFESSSYLGGVPGHREQREAFLW